MYSISKKLFNSFSNIYPHDTYAKKAIKKEIHFGMHDLDSDYLEAVESNVRKAVEIFNPSFILYNAGTDCMEGDPLGCMNLKKETIIKRDEIMFTIALTSKIPILMVLSGGYQQSNAPCIAESIQNLMTIIQLNKADYEDKNRL